MSLFSKKRRPLKQNNSTESGGKLGTSELKKTPLENFQQNVQQTPDVTSFLGQADIDDPTFLAMVQTYKNFVAKHEGSIEPYDPSEAYDDERSSQLRLLAFLHKRGIQETFSPDVISRVIQAAVAPINSKGASPSVDAKLYESIASVKMTQSDVDFVASCGRAFHVLGLAGPKNLFTQLRPGSLTSVLRQRIISFALQQRKARDINRAAVFSLLDVDKTADVNAMLGCISAILDVNSVMASVSNVDIPDVAAKIIDDLLTS